MATFREVFAADRKSFAAERVNFATERKSFAAERVTFIDRIESLHLQYNNLDKEFRDRISHEWRWQMFFAVAVVCLLIGLDRE
jgi:hypothetical protein